MDNSVAGRVKEPDRSETPVAFPAMVAAGLGVRHVEAQDSDDLHPRRYRLAAPSSADSTVHRCTPRDCVGVGDSVQIHVIHGTPRDCVGVGDSVQIHVIHGRWRIHRRAKALFYPFKAIYPKQPGNARYMKMTEKALPTVSKRDNTVIPTVKQSGRGVIPQHRK